MARTTRPSPNPTVGGPAASSPVQGDTSPVEAARTTVLVIEDEPAIMELLRINFELEGFTVICATDGEEGLARAQQDQPDVVIADIRMPRRDGLGVLTELRADPATEHLPVILLSANAQKSDIQLGLDLGADDYVTKPFDPIALIERLNAVVDRAVVDRAVVDQAVVDQAVVDRANDSDEDSDGAGPGWAGPG
ncbi:MAG: response regulator transcription factor [Acidimicrobiales bacterium]